MASNKAKHRSVKFTPEEMAFDPSPEDLKKWKVVGRGREAISGKPPSGKSITLDKDVAEVFPDAKAVNEALRSLIQLAQNSIKKRKKTA